MGEWRSTWVTEKCDESDSPAFKKNESVYNDGAYIFTILGESYFQAFVLGGWKAQKSKE